MKKENKSKQDFYDEESEKIRNYFLEHVCDLADGEVNCPLEKQEFRNIIEVDDLIKFEYDIQSLAKYVVLEHKDWRNTPDTVKLRIIEKIRKEKGNGKD